MKYFQGGRIRTVYETGFSGFVLHRELVKQGINNIVVHAAGVEVAVNNRVKTDKRDAQKLAALLEAGRLKGIGIPTHTLLATPNPDANQRAASRRSQWGQK